MSCLHRTYPRLARHQYKLLVVSLLVLVLGPGFTPASTSPRLFAGLL